MIDKLEWLQTKIGQSLAWLTLLLVLVTFAVVVLRYAFGLGWVSMQESLTYMHAIIFMGGMAYTLQQSEHVRVDIFYQSLSPKKKAWVDLIGTLLFLLPMCVVLVWLSWDYVSNAWAIKEGAIASGGIPYLYLLKSMLLVMAVLLGLQGLLFAYQKIRLLVQ